jgi:hypothetical protein
MVVQCKLSKLQRPKQVCQLTKTRTIPSLLLRTPSTAREGFEKEEALAPGDGTRAREIQQPRLRPRCPEANKLGCHANQIPSSNNARSS